MASDPLDLAGPCDPRTCITRGNISSYKISINAANVSRPRGKVCRCSFVIDLYCRHFVPYLVLALIINHCFNKLPLPTQQASPSDATLDHTEYLMALLRGKQPVMLGEKQTACFVRQTQSTVQRRLSDTISTRSRVETQALSEEGEMKKHFL